MHREPNLEPEVPELGGNIVIPTWLAWGIGAISVPITVYVMTTLHSIDDRLRNRWSKDEMREYTHSVHDHNPSLNLPDVDEIGRRIDGEGR